ncbi:MAG: MFS transporter [Bacteroidetes bacterium]|nr:MAG: MFS transporter [Bacteroidota bacterium]
MSHMIITGDMNTGSIPTIQSTGTVVLPVAKHVSTHRLILVFSICFLSVFLGGTISMLMPGYLPAIVHGLAGNLSQQKQDGISALINSLFIFGWMFGGVAWGIISDKTGRARSLILSTACLGIFSIVTAVSSSWSLVVVSRFLSGFGIGGVMVIAVILVAELWTGKSIAVIQGFISLAMPLGFFAAGAINNLIANWRSAFWIGILPVLLAIIAAFYLPESEKWKTGRILKRQKNNAGMSFLTLAYRNNLFTGSLIFGTMLIGVWAVFSWAPSWVQSISSSVNVQTQRGSIMMILAGAGIVGSFFSGWIVNSIGVRKTMLLCFAACFIMIFLSFKLNVDITRTTFIEIGILAFFFGVSQGALAVFIPSLFPVNVCASATGFCFNAGRLFTASVVFFIGSLVSWLGGYGNAVFIFSFVLLVGLIATFLSTGHAVSTEKRISNELIPD